MKTYKNVELGRTDMDELSMIEAVKESLLESYPNSLNDETAFYVAQLMVIHDTDIYEANGQFSNDINDL